MMSLRDWRKALRSPPAYRVGNSTLRIQTQFVTVIGILGVLVLILIYASVSSRSSNTFISYGLGNDINRQAHFKYSCVHNEVYNSTYPLTAPMVTPHGIKYRIGLISDMDKKSKSLTEPNTWISHYYKGYLLWNTTPVPSVSVVFDNEPITLKTKFSENGRGMELSELVVFNGKLLTFDDRTGVVYEIDGDEARSIPWVILTNGNGKTDKGFKSEWATVKDNMLYVGSMGKEWTTSTGKFINNHPMWVKKITPQGEVEHEDWQKRYMALRETVGVKFPGYIIHESGVWSSIHKKWFFLPRRMSKERYDDNTDEHLSTNILFSTDENFNDIEVTYIGALVPTHGFSSFKFIPGTNHEVIVALKSEEDGDVIATYLMVFNIKGEILLPETKVYDGIKYEGIEFI